MSSTYRLSFEFAATDDRRTIDDARWSLSGLDPSFRVRAGSFGASDGEKIPYRLWKANEPRATVLLLHGATDYSAAFDEIGPQFAARGLTALAIDQRGFGATSTRGRWRGRRRMIRDAIESVLYLRMRFGEHLPVFIVGESMGAALAVHTAAQAPDVGLAGIVLVAPGAISGTWRRLVGHALTRVLRFFMPHSSFIIERISAWEFTPGSAIRLLSDPMVLRRVRPATLFGLFKLSRSAVDEAGHVRVPSLTMIGGKEDLLREDCIRRLYNGLSGDKQWARFKNGPHLLLHWKNRDKVLSRLFAWTDGQLARRPFNGPQPANP